ncbi:MAG: hypothetical protein ABI585_04375 [Betaproteobacteria bacterium]
MPLDLPRLSLDADFWSLRFVDQTATGCAVRKNVAGSGTSGTRTIRIARRAASPG